MTTKWKTRKASSTKPSASSRRLSNATASAEAWPQQARALVRRVQNFAHQESLWQKKERLVVAVSGGADSLCLLDMLAYLAPKYEWALVVVHVNYRLRGPHSDGDEALVKARARAYGWPCYAYHPRIPRRGNLEENLRTVRYRLLEKVRERTRASRIVVAHHADDQAETLLLRLLRGSGLQGLGAMRPRTETVIRPLLTTSRVEIRSYLSARKLPFREDQSNRDPRFLRNRIRHELLPYLEKHFQPAIRPILARTAAHLARDYAHLKRESRDAGVDAVPGTADLSFSAAAALLLPEALLRQELRRLFSSFLESPRLPQSLISETLKLLKSRKSKTQEFRFRGLILHRRGDTVRLLKNRNRTSNSTK